MLERSFRVFAKASFVLSLRALGFYCVEGVVDAFELGEEVGEGLVLEVEGDAEVGFGDRAGYRALGVGVAAEGDRVADGFLE